MPTHVPERTCVACRQKRPQRELLRLTLGAQGWQLDQPGQVRRGRGLYLCADPRCWQEKALRRAFRAEAGAVSATLQAAKTSEQQPSHETDQPMST